MASAGRLRLTECARGAGSRCRLAVSGKKPACDSAGHQGSQQSSEISQYHGYCRCPAAATTAIAEATRPPFPPLMFLLILSILLYALLLLLLLAINRRSRGQTKCWHVHIVPLYREKLCQQDRHIERLHTHFKTDLALQKGNLEKHW